MSKQPSSRKRRKPSRLWRRTGYHPQSATVAAKHLPLAVGFNYLTAWRMRQRDPNSFPRRSEFVARTQSLDPFIVGKVAGRSPGRPSRDPPTGGTARDPRRRRHALGRHRRAVGGRTPQCAPHVRFGCLVHAGAVGQRRMHCAGRNRPRPRQPCRRERTGAGRAVLHRVR